MEMQMRDKKKTNGSESVMHHNDQPVLNRLYRTAFLTTTALAIALC
jgi:hypothetical protein